MGIGPPRLHRRLIGTVSLLAAAGLFTAPVSWADTSVGVVVEPSVPAVTETAAQLVPPLVEPVVAAIEPAIEAPAPLPAAAPLPTAELPRSSEPAGLVSSARAAIGAPSRPHAAAASTPPLATARPTHARAERAGSVKAAPRLSRESSSGAPAPLGRSAPAITAEEPVAIPVPTGSERPEQRQAAAPQRLPEPSVPAGAAAATGAAPGFVLAFLALGLALLLSRFGLGARIALLLASPRSAALVLELERPG